MTGAAVAQRADTEWGSERLDLAAYLDRIGVAGPVPPTAETLTRLHRAQALALPFENLDVVLGRGIDLDIDAIQDKLLRRRRGGYCYEQNLLLAAALERTGLAVDRLFARPLLEMSSPIPRTHVVLRVRTDRQDHLADVGFGDEGPLEPVPFTDGAVSEQDGWTYRMDRAGVHGTEWVLSLLRDDRWFPLYWFSHEPHHLIDCEVANHFISTHHRSPFVGRVFLESIRPGERANLNNRTLTRRRSGGHVEVTEITDDEFAPLLSEFGIHLDTVELEVARRALPSPR